MPVPFILPSIGTMASIGTMRQNADEFRKGDFSVSLEICVMRIGFKSFLTQTELTPKIGTFHWHIGIIGLFSQFIKSLCYLNESSGLT